MTPLENYVEQFTALNYLIRSPSCPNNVYQIANQFNKDMKSFRDASLNLFEVNGRHYYPQDSFIHKLNYTKKGQLIIQYECSASLLTQFISNPDIYTEYMVELKLQVSKILPLRAQKDDLIVDIIFDEARLELLLITRRNEGKLISNIIPYQTHSFSILRSRRRPFHIV